jgi:nucleotide-binding universal stress UspA family protein
MFESRRILMTTDLSPLSFLAWDAALSLAQRFEVPLFVLHVLEKGRKAAVDEELSVAEDAIFKALRETCEQRTDGGLVEVLVTSSSHVVKEILDEVERLDVDLLVTATHGRTGLAGAVYGSTAEKLVRLCPVPVVSVRVKNLPRSPEDPAREREEAIRRILPRQGR